MDDARRDRIAVIFDKHAAPALRSEMLHKIPYRAVAPRDTLNTVELLEWLLQTIFSLDQAVAFTNGRKTAVRFMIGIATGEKKSVSFMAQHAYPGHFFAHKSRDHLISYGRRILEIPVDSDWRVLLEVEIQLPVPRLVPWMPIPPREDMIIVDLRQIFDKFETNSLLLKDRTILDVMKQHFPTEQWEMGAIYKIPETPEEAKEMEEAWDSAQAFDPNPTNLPAMMKKIQMMTKALTDQLPMEKSKAEELKALVGKLENSQRDFNNINLLFNLELQVANDPAEAESHIMELLSRDPRQVELWLMLGSLLAGEFRWEEALRAFMRSKDIAPTNSFATDCIGIAVDALGGRPYQGKWEIQEPVGVMSPQTNTRDPDLADFHKKESLKRTLQALALHYYRMDPKRGEKTIDKMLAKCSDEEKVFFYNSMAWKQYSQPVADPGMLTVGMNFAKRGVALGKKIKSKLLVNCLDSQACLASKLGKHKDSKSLFEEAASLAHGHEELITWAEFARVLKALGDDASYQRYKQFF